MPPREIDVFWKSQPHCPTFDRPHGLPAGAGCNTVRVDESVGLRIGE